MKSPDRQQGFTLLEMLVAIALFAILSMSAYQVLRSVLRTSEMTKQHAEALSRLQYAFDWMDRDLSHAMIRPVQRLSAIVRPDFTAGPGVDGSEADGIEIVHNNWLNPGWVQPRSQFERAGYRLRNGELERLSYPLPDMPEQTLPRVTSLLSGVSQFKLRYFDGSRWQTRWQASTLLPKAIEVTLVIQNKGTVSRIWMLNNSGAIP